LQNTVVRYLLIAKESVRWRSLAYLKSQRINIYMMIYRLLENTKSSIDHIIKGYPQIG